MSERQDQTRRARAENKHLLSIHVDGSTKTPPMGRLDVEYACITDEFRSEILATVCRWIDEGKL